MFTGIVEAIGEIADMQPSGGDLRLRIRTGKLDLGDVRLGDSICTLRGHARSRRVVRRSRHRRGCNLASVLPEDVRPRRRLRRS